MATTKTYATGAAFRVALEERLKQKSQTDQVDINRLRRKVSFDRLLARLFSGDSAPWALKGGYALELRFKSARSTVDIDLALQRAVSAAVGSSDANQIVRETLQAAASKDLGDWFEYIIGPAILDITAAPYGGARYPVEVQMGGRIFAKFHLDVGIGDVVMRPLETAATNDWLAFAGIAPSPVRMIAREQHFAEKVHAYTLPRSSPNSRVKDLVDLALLIGEGKLDREKCADALRLTFERRDTHHMPTTLGAPPHDWQIPFEALAKECGLRSDLSATFKIVRSFYETKMEPHGIP
jgi:nucleotidyltransferase AbiEii toxin of type IV toxin-antitoxin system